MRTKRTISLIAALLFTLFGVSGGAFALDAEPKSPSAADIFDEYKSDASLYSYPQYTPLAVYFSGDPDTAAAGEWIQVEAFRNGEQVSDSELAYEVVYGRDIAEVYYNGSVLAFGTGSVVVRAYLSADESVEGYAEIEFVTPEGENTFLIRNTTSSRSEIDALFENDIAQFPECYKPYLRALHAKYPSWVFEPMFTGVDFSEAVYNECLYDRNTMLVANFADVFRSKAVGDYDRDAKSYILKDTGWVTANALAVSYFMNPLNFLDERSVFQFESLEYDSAYQTLEGVNGILNGSFMYDAATSYYDTEGNLIETTTTYAEAIMSAAEATGVNPYYLAAKIRGEIGSTASNSANGLCPGYEGYYNFYNIGATDGEGNIERGLEWAMSGSSYNRPWTSPVKSILGGAEWVADNYVNDGQYTGYLQKFNVNPEAVSEMYTHQYMTSVSGAAGQGISAYNGYAEVGALSGTIVFSIPVYENMPEATGKISELSLGVSGTASHGLVVRTAPSAASDATGDFLSAGTRVTIVKSVFTDALNMRTVMTYPHWYEIEYDANGETKKGYVSAEFIAPVVSQVISVGETFIFGGFESTPANSGETIFYYSENEGVASVSADGTVMGTGRGTATVIAYTAGGLAVKIKVAVI